MLGLVPFSDVGGLRRSWKRGPCPGDVGGICWVIVLVRHHGPLTLAHIPWVSAACATQVDAFPASVSDQQSLVECVAWSRVVGLYEGVLLGKGGLPGVIAVDDRFRSRWFDAPHWFLRRNEVIPGLPYRLLTCGWPVRNLHRTCTAMRRRCTAGDRPGVGRARVCRVGWGVAVLTVLPRVFMRVCSRSRLAVVQGSGGFHAPHEGAAEGTEDFVHKRRVCRLGLRLSVNGGLQLLAHRQGPDLVDREDGAQVGRCGGLCRPVALGDGLRLLPAVQVEPPCRHSVPGVRRAAPRPPPGAVEGMA